MSAPRRLAGLVGALFLFRLGSALVVFQPGYTDAYYYANVAKRLAAGQGLTADFIWNFIEATPGSCVGCLSPNGAILIDVPSHQFWMPLATVLQAIGIKSLPFLDAFHAAQAIEILIACAIPVIAYAAARSLGASTTSALVAATLAGLGGAFAPGWVSLDAFAPAAAIGTVFFLSYRRAAAGDARSGAIAGLAVGLLFLARAEGALFGIALLSLLRAPTSRRAGVLGVGIASVVGLAWFARDVSLGGQADLLGRTVFLSRYDAFFSMIPVRGGAALLPILDARPAALLTNLVTFVFAFGLLLVPGLVRAIWMRPDRADVRAFGWLIVLVYLVESIAFALHSTRGSYFHSLAAFFPYGIALGVVGTGELLRLTERRRTAAVGGIVGAALISVFALAQWDESFNAPYRQRIAVASRIPSGLFMAIDAAAWRWITDRPVVVSPPDGDPGTYCRLSEMHVNALVLEPAHFNLYDGLYRGEDTRFGPPDVIAGIKIYQLDQRELSERCNVR